MIENDRPEIWINLSNPPSPESLGKDVLKVLMSNQAKTVFGNRVVIINGS